MDLGSIHACVSACDACNDERGSGWGAACGPDLHLTRIHVHAFERGLQTQPIVGPLPAAAHVRSNVARCFYTFGPPMVHQRWVGCPQLAQYSAACWCVIQLPRVRQAGSAINSLACRAVFSLREWGSGARGGVHRAFQAFNARAGTWGR